MNNSENHGQNETNSEALILEAQSTLYRAQRAMKAYKALPDLNERIVSAIVDVPELYEYFEKNKAKLPRSICMDVDIRMKKYKQKRAKVTLPAMRGPKKKRFKPILLRGSKV